MELKARVEKEFLPDVTKPTRYLGNEFNSIEKDLSNVKLHIALCYPAPCERGMADTGFEILYYTLNSIQGIWAERIFLPALDAQTIMRERNISLFSLESKTPIGDFQVVAFTIRHEVEYPHILTMLELGNLPLRTAARREEHPLLFGGGIAAWNPEPLAEFFDLLLLGHWEAALYQACLKIIENSGSTVQRNNVLQILMEMPGVYLPSRYRAVYNSFGEFQELQLLSAPASKHIEPFKSDMVPAGEFFVKPLIPVTAPEFPLPEWEYRYGSVPGNSDVLNPGNSGDYAPWQFKQQLLSELPGLNDFHRTLLRLNLCDNISAVWYGIKMKIFLSRKELGFSFPDFRLANLPGTFQEFRQGLIEDCFTVFAGPANMRLRTITGNYYRDEDLLGLLNLLLQMDIKKIQLNFTIGLPTEKEEDLRTVAKMAAEAAELIKQNSAGELIIFVSCFVPTPFTVFQWDGMDSPAQIGSKMEFLKTTLDLPGISVVFENVTDCLVRGILRRGDRPMAGVLEKVLQLTAGESDAREPAKLSLWSEALQACGKSWEQLLAPMSVSVPLPWDHIDTGVNKAALKSRRLKAGKIQPDEKMRARVVLGEELPRSDFEAMVNWKMAAGSDESSQPDPQTPSQQVVRFGRKQKRTVTASAPVKKKIRIRYAKTGLARFFTHQDVARAFEMAARRADVRLIYTQGKRPHPKISFGPPLGLGIASTAEYLDFEIMGISWWESGIH
ncbi:MAG: TIGR03936 family radical SAM-associated protein [Calditrichia bacterium]